MLIVYQELGHNLKWHYSSDDYVFCPTLPLASTRPSHISRSPYAALKKKKINKIKSDTKPKADPKPKSNKEEKQKIKPDEKAYRPVEMF